MLWSLRNRLIVAYLFIALVPVLLTAVLTLFFATLLYRQFGGYILSQDLRRRVNIVEAGGEQIASALEHAPPSMQEQVAEKIISDQEHTVYDSDLPGLTIEITPQSAHSSKIPAGPKRSFAGFVQQDKRLFLVSVRAVKSPYGERIIHLRAPITSSFLSSLAPELGSVQLVLLDLSAANPADTLELSGQKYQTATTIFDRHRILQSATGFWDADVSGVTRFEALVEGTDGRAQTYRPVLARFTTRPSQLNSMMFASVGDLGLVYVYTLGVLAVLFFLVEIAALITGVVMTRRITSAVDGLYRATQFVQNRDFSHRVKIESRDQLGVLGESFNLMVGDISNFIEEQKRHQRLENEISIAREVQSQLFPQKLPAIQGVQLEAVCKAARMVSGDYYDFIQLNPTTLAIAVADISGKGISAALLMASLQASLRSLLLAPGCITQSTGELVAQLNNHLVRNTGDDRFATFFIAIYDSSSRILRYTNAGHLPAFCICDGAAVSLEEGGMVLGVVEDYVYEEGKHLVPKHAMLVGYSDGLIEPENVYGEEFGIHRLRDAAIRLHNGSPRTVALGLMQAADEWAGTPEQADDMTVIVARME
ncbi:MAG TPA: PP2C family protein-serine/threonine phosphatase [Candidatus Acidoferrum sp.]|nr:PP2C family protein-serine/threonine phosphatase [Candidatus Acidoferrum sp.]